MSPDQVSLNTRSHQILDQPQFDAYAKLFLHSSRVTRIVAEWSDSLHEQSQSEVCGVSIAVLMGEAVHAWERAHQEFCEAMEVGVKG